MNHILNKKIPYCPLVVKLSLIFYTVYLLPYILSFIQALSYQRQSLGADLFSFQLWLFIINNYAWHVWADSTAVPNVIPASNLHFSVSLFSLYLFPSRAPFLLPSSHDNTFMHICKDAH